MLKLTIIYILIIGWAPFYKHPHNSPAYIICIARRTTCSFSLGLNSFIYNPSHIFLSLVEDKLVCIILNLLSKTLIISSFSKWVGISLILIFKLAWYVWHSSICFLIACGEYPCWYILFFSCCLVSPRYFCPQTINN